MTLSFFRPSFLWALSLLAIPIAIHFFNRRRTRKLKFSTVRFFGPTALAANRARNLRRIVQLIARLGIVTLLVLLFARPFNPQSPFAVLTDPGCMLYTWVDPTVSMRYREERSRVELAATALDTLVTARRGAGPPLGYEEKLQTFVPLSGKPLVTRHGRAEEGRMLAALRKRLSRQRGGAVLAVLSDLQAPTTTAFDSALAADSLPCPIVFVDLSPANPANRGILSARVPVSNGRVVEVAVVDQGQAGAGGQVVASLDELRAGRAAFTFEEGDTARAWLDLPEAAGEGVGQVHIEPADAFPLDDTCTFVREAAAARRVLIVGDTRRVYPLTAALGATGGDFWERISVKEARAVTLEDVDEAAVIVLDSVVHASRAIAALLSGRGLGRKVVVVSPALTLGAIGFVRTVLQGVGHPGPVSVDSSESGLGVRLSDTISALWRGFPRVRDEDVRVYRWVRGIPGAVLLRLQNGRPLATMLDDTAGHVWVVCATPLTIAEENNLAETGFYVPLLDRIIRHALAGASPQSESWVAGTPQRNPFFGRRGGASVIAADGRRVGRWESQPLVILERPGVYRVVPDGQSGYRLRAVLDPAEARMAYARPHIPPHQRSRVHTVKPSELGPFLREAGRRGPSRLFWLLLALCVLVEMVLWGVRTPGSPLGRRTAP